MHHRWQSSSRPAKKSQVSIIRVVAVAQKVTGLVVNDRPGVTRKEVRRLRAILHRARAEGLDRQNREQKPNFRAWLQGKIAYVGMVRPEVGAKLSAELRPLLERG